MSNEELVKAIQQGDKSLIPQLWSQVEKLVKWKAVRYARGFRDSSRRFYQPEVDDLYQSGFLAVEKAIHYFNADGPFKFVTYLDKRLLSEFKKVSGTVRKREALLEAFPLDAPLNTSSGDDDDGFSMLDTLPDPEPDAYEAWMEDTCLLQRTAVVFHALDQIPPREKEILIKRHMGCQTWQQIADQYHISGTRAQVLERHALKKLKSMPEIQQIIENGEDF